MGERISDKAVEALANICYKISNEPLFTKRRAELSNIFKVPGGQELFDLAVSITTVLESPINLQVKRVFRQRGQEVKKSFEESLGSVYKYYMTGDIIEMKKVIQTLPYSHQLVIAFIFSKKLLSVTLDFLLENVSTLYSEKEYISKFMKFPLEAEYTEAFGRLKVQSSTEVGYPFIVTGVRKFRKTRVQGLFYFVKDGGKVISNLTWGRLRSYLRKIYKDRQYVAVLFYVRKIVSKTETKYALTPIVYTNNVQEFKKLFKKKSSININEFEYNYKFPSAEHIINSRIYSALITSEDELLSIFSKNASKFFIISSNGAHLVSLKETVDYFKVVDFILNDDFEPVGVSYLNHFEDKIENIYCRLPDYVTDEGLDTLYVKVIFKMFNGKVVKTVHGGFSLGGFRMCHVCGKISTGVSKHLCLKHYKQLLNICKGSLEEIVEIPCVPFKAGQKAHLDKYEVSFEETKIVLRRDFSQVKGQQLSLPFLLNEELLECKD